MTLIQYIRNLFTGMKPEGSRVYVGQKQAGVTVNPDFGDGAGAAVLSACEDGRPGTGMYPPHLAHEYSATAIGLGNSNNTTCGASRRRPTGRATPSSSAPSS